MQFNLVQMKNESNSFINVFTRIFVYNARNIKIGEYINLCTPEVFMYSRSIYVLEKYVCTREVLLNF